MIAISKGTDREGLSKETSSFSIINSNSPLQYDKPMAIGLIELAKHNQLAMITPFSLAGLHIQFRLALRIHGSRRNAGSAYTNPISQSRRTRHQLHIQ